MIFLTIIGIAAYFVLPNFIILWLLDRNDYKIFGWDVDIIEVILPALIIEIAFFVQIMAWLPDDSCFNIF